MPNELPVALPHGIGIAVTEQGSTTTIALKGEWDLAAVPTTRQAIRQALDRHPESVVLDLHRLSFIDSSGLHITLELHKRAARQNTRLVIVPGPRAVQRPFEICKLTQELPFLPATQE